MSLPAQAGDLRPGDLSHLLYSGPVNESEPSTTAGSVEVALLVRLFGPLVHARLVLIVLLLALIAWVAVGDPALWRRQILIFVGLGLTGLSVFEVMLVRRLGVTAVPVALDLGAMMFFQVLIVVCTGGLESPVLPAMLPLAALLGFLGESRATLAIVGGLQIPVVWLCAWLQASGYLGQLLPETWSAPTHHSALNGAGTIMAALAMSLALMGASLLTHRARTVARKLLREVLRGRDAALREHRARADEMTRLNAEIAHELKNPLATVKGLGALLARDLTGEAGQRLAVLRREVDRMQQVLDDFLNFTRPVVPLDLAQVRIDQLAGEVCQLHEGMAAQLGVRLQLIGAGPLEALCDHRKLRQVVINLLQNALEITPSGKCVDVRVQAGPTLAGQETASIIIDDQGPGIAAELRDRVFQAGVTSKAQGSGLGLAIARGLVEQHRGQLTLGPHEGGSGGTRARVDLPIAGLADMAAQEVAS